MEGKDRMPSATPPSSASPTLADVAGFEESLRRLYQALRAPLLRELAGHKLSYSAASILFIVSRRGPCTMGTLKQELGLAHSTLTGLVDTLVRRELLVREPAVHDRRVIQVRLTPAGQTLIHDLRQKRVRFLADHWPQQIDARTLQDVTALLATLAEAARRAGDDDART